MKRPIAGSRQRRGSVVYDVFILCNVEQNMEVGQSWSTTLQAQPDSTVVASVLVRFRCGRGAAMRHLSNKTVRQSDCGDEKNGLPLLDVRIFCCCGRKLACHRIVSWRGWWWLGTLERRVSSPLDETVNIIQALMVLPRRRKQQTLS